MKLIRLQDNTPEIYTYASRDFQLFCRLYDCINNGFIYDTSTMTDLLNTKNCRSNILPLLQTKVGYFSTLKDIDDNTLRLILSGFPILLKNKGSLKAVRYAINIYLKSLGLNLSYSIWKSKDGDENLGIPSHSIVINIDYSFLNTNLLKNLLDYLIPGG